MRDLATGDKKYIYAQLTENMVSQAEWCVVTNINGNGSFVNSKTRKQCQFNTNCVRFMCPYNRRIDHCIDPGSSFLIISEGIKYKISIL